MDELAPAISTATLGDTDWELSKTCRAGGPVTCVCLRPSLSSSLHDHQEDVTLARVWALGPYLFRCHGSGTQEQALIFPQEVGGTIHGISFRESETVDESTACWDAIVYGGRQLAVCRVLIGLGSKMCETTGIHRFNVSHDETPKSHLMASDWIWDVKILSDWYGGAADAKKRRKSSTTTLALGLGRHTVELWGVSRNVSTLDSVPLDQVFLDVSCLTRIPGSPPCLVMSMNLWQHGNRLWIASGTAFQVIQVWSVALDEDMPESERGDEACLQGHKGVIHSVQWARDGQSIVSTSDDRSVRLWTRQSHIDAADLAWQEKWVAWGHTARVWTASYITDAVVSIAEDATARIWSLKTGEPLSCIHHATGLWSMSICYDLALVGATDGTTVTYNLSRRISGRELEVIESIPVPDDRPTSIEITQEAEGDNVIGQVGIKKKKKKASKSQHQIIVGMLWRNRDEILVATRAGSLMALSVSTGIWRTHHPWWTPHVTSPGISSSEGCCMVFCNDYVAIGTTRGDIIVQRLNEGTTESQPCHLLSGKQFKSVHRLKWFPESAMLMSFHVRSAAIWKFSDLQHIETRTEPNVALLLETKGSPKCCIYVHEHNQVLIGDMRGNLLLFQLPSAISTDEHIGTLQASSVLLRVHKREHINDIAIQGDIIRSVGNDGCIHTSYRKCTSLQMGFSVPVVSMTSLIKVWTTQGKFDRCVVSGFYGNVYRIVDVWTGLELFEMDTGGRQRIHDLYFPTNDNAELGPIHMAVCMNEKTGANRIAIRRQKSSLRIERNAGSASCTNDSLRVHGETIFDACFFSLGTDRLSSFLLTASEDCSSRIFRCRENNLCDAMPLTPQESCVRAVCTSQFDNTSSLIVVGGGKVTIQFFLAKSTQLGPKMITSLNDMEVFFLGHGFGRKRVVIDQRINVVKASPLEGSGLERHHLVVGGDSAGQCFIDIVSEDALTRPMPGVVIQVSDHPILSMALLPAFGRILVVFGNTAGEVILYDLPRSESILREELPTLEGKWQPRAAFQAHQMGANAMLLSAEAIDEVSAEATIVTGGDDQAISICEFQISLSSDGSSLSPGPFSVTREPNASFSALKGICELPSPNNCCKYFLTTGYTQRLALWKWENAKLEVVKHLPVDVGDVNALAACQDGSGVLAAVVGFGVELFSLVPQQ